MQIPFVPHVVLPAWSGPLGIGAVAGTPSKRGGIQIEGQVE
jgi:hypothetical protein